MQDALRELERRVEIEGATEESLRAFWRVVNRLKLQEQIPNDVFNRIIKVRDRLWYEKYPAFLSLWQGLTLTAVATLVGVVLAWYALQSVDTLAFVAAEFLMLAGTHSWGHWIVGKLVGVNYEYFYLDGPAKFEPCLKIDYRDYLRAGFDSRRILHASGALATLLTAFVLLTVAFATNSFEIRGIATVAFVVVVATEAASFAGFASGDLKRARREGRLKRLYMKRKRSFR